MKTTTNPSKGHKHLPEKRFSETSFTPQPVTEEETIDVSRGLVANKAVMPVPTIQAPATYT